MLQKSCVVAALAIVVGCGSALAQDVTNENLAGASRVQRAPEPDLPGLTRRDQSTVVFSLGPRRPGAAPDQITDLVLHDFSFNGDPVTTDKLHLRQVAPGVVEVTSVAWEVGYWRFRARDAASY